MATEKSYNLIRNLEEDWELDERNNLPYSGQSVQEVIKRYLSGHEVGKFGSVLTTTDTDKLTTVRFFANDDAMEAWQADPDNHSELVLKSFSIQGAAEANEYTLAARVVKALDVVQVAGEENIFTFSYNSYWGSDTTDLDAQAGSAVVLVNNVEVTRLSLQSGGNNHSINVGQFITQETNNVKITVSNAHGKSRMWEYTVEAKSLSIAFAESYLNLQHTAKPAGWSLPIQVNGVGGTVYVSVDDGVLEYSHQVMGGSQYTFYIDSNGRLERGTHTIEVWCEDSVYGLTSNHIKTSYIVESQSMGVAIGANAPTEVTMYDTVQIPYYFYTPSDSEGETVDVTIEVKDENDITISSTHQSVAVDVNHSSGLRQAVVQIMNNDYIDTDVTLEISIGQGAGVVTASHTLSVNAAETTLREASECKVYYNMAGKTNSDADVVANAMTSSYNGSQTSQFVRSADFSLKDGNGFRNGGFLIPAQKRATLKDWKPFAIDFGVNGSHEGKTIEMEFASGLAADTDTPIVSCMDSRCGFEIFPTRIEVKYAGSDSRIITYFPDEERIKFSLVINGTATNCVNDDGNGNVESTERNLGFIYVNGVIVRIFDYGVSSWQQQTIKEIVFGSDECELTIYSIRGYDKALTMKEVLDNFSYDTPLLADKISIAKRNNILESDGKTVNKGLVEAALPNTPIITWWMERLPANKKDPRECLQTDFKNPEWTEDKGRACAPFTAGSHEINGDGTSSNSYPLPYKNWVEKYKDFNGGSQGIITLHLTSGDETVKKYSITYGIENAETKFVHKVNFASSEGIFNILAMNMYQQITLNAYRSINDLLSLQQQAQADAGNDITFRKSLSGFPEIGFRTYTENGQVVTKFLSIYNFINNKKTGSMFGMVEDYKVNQLWEIDENVNFFNTPMTEHSVDGENNVVESNGVRERSPFYYSRFPADSPVNSGNDLGIATQVSEVAQANDEIRALRLVHNWIVSINPNVAERYYAKNGEYRAFTLAEDGFTSKTYAGTEFTRDTPAYRAQKFIDECDDFLHTNDCIFYFLFCTYIIGMDSMDKNMSLFFDTVADFYSDDAEVRAAAKVRLRIMLRDTDTGELFNNSGVLTYKYWHEWNDTYNTETGETGQITGETYDPETQSYSIVTNVEGSSPVFNGRMSGLWDAINTFIPNQVRTLYQTMRQAGLNYNTFMAMYQRFRNYWCEALYNVDGLGYANTGNFTMAYGDKNMVSKYFFKYRERYMDSKYGYALDAHQVTLRLSSVPNGIWMKHCTPIYASFSYGGSNPTTARSIEVGEPALLPCMANTFNDATCYINDADLVTEIGTYTMQAGGTPILNGWEGMQNFHFTFNFARLVRLQKFIWANTQERPNTEQTTSNGNIEFDNLKLLKELVMTYCTAWTGSPVIGSDIIEKIDFRGTPIVSIVIPETETLTELRLPATLRELNLVNLPNIATFSIAGVGNLETINISGTSIDAFDIVSQLFEMHANGDDIAIQSITLDNINESLSSNGFDLLMWLTEVPNVNITGTITLDNSVRLTFLQKEQLVKAFGNIDSDENPLRIHYSYSINNALEVAIFCDGVADMISQTGTYQFRYIPMVAGSMQEYANYISQTEWVLESNRFATIDENGLMTVTSVGNAATTPTITLTLRATLLNGTVLTDSLTISMYEKDIELGDYVFADGTYSKTDYLVKTKVGIVFLNENGIKEICMLTNLRSDQWGLYNNSNNGVTGVTVDGTTPAYDTPLPNIGSNGTSPARDTNTNYWDSANDEFKPLSNGSAAGQLIFQPSVDTLIDGLIENVQFEAGNKYPAGYHNTLLIMQWRNRILTYAEKDIPAANENETETQCLTRLINAIIAEAGNKNNYRQYYYPAASYCYAYQPTIKPYETLNDKFKAHKWFLPSGGELARMIFYWLRNDSTGNSKYDAFKAAKAASKISFSSSSYWSSTEYSGTHCWNVDGGDGAVNGNPKYNSGIVRAVCAL